ncbi:hypothetical protein [Streptomyces sp. NPDC002994]|uniref:hypothetical protein n=1 Tax=Streptomyces sp. NPDC002994 TaxID=3154441 RepID=UPI0033B23DA7
MSVRAAAGWLSAGLVTLSLVTGCNNCTGSVCGNQNSGNDVKEQAAAPPAAPIRETSPRPESAIPSSPTKEEYVKAADAICQKWTRQADKHTTPGFVLSQELLTTLMSLATDMANEWQAMTPPPGDDGRADVFIEKQYADAAAMKRVRDLWAAGDTDRAQVELDQVAGEELLAERRADARAYGFRVCY